MEVFVYSFLNSFSFQINKIKLKNLFHSEDTVHQSKISILTLEMMPYGNHGNHYMVFLNIFLLVVTNVYHFYLLIGKVVNLSIGKFWNKVNVLMFVKYKNFR